MIDNRKQIGEDRMRVGRTRGFRTKKEEKDISNRSLKRDKAEWFNLIETERKTPLEFQVRQN